METKEPKFIDITPTWRGLLPLLVETAVNGNSADGRRASMTELGRLCDIADGEIERQKVTKQAAALLAGPDESTVLRAMRDGGSFCDALAQCFQVADSGNRALLTDAFAPLFLRFAPDTIPRP